MPPSRTASAPLAAPEGAGPLAVALETLVAGSIGSERLVRRLLGGALSPAGLSYREDVLEQLRAARAAGRRTWLTAGGHEAMAREIAAHLGLFDEVVPGEAASARLAEPGVEIAQAAAPAKSPLRLLPKALRVHQWAKNVLVLVPAFTAHRLGEGRSLWHLAVAAAAFCLCASAVYLVNDLADLDSDRRHRSKKKRPLAAGTFPITWALVLAPILTLAAFGGAALIGAEFVAVLGAYLATTTLYSFWLKREAIVDVVLLAGLYTLRIFAGASAAGVVLSPWLLAFSMFVFLSLALVKRVSELRAMPAGPGSVPGRGYAKADAELLVPMGVACGYLAVLVFALWIHLGGVDLLYSSPRVLWLLCPLLFSWISRAWLLTHRGQMNDDPVEFAARDRVSWAFGAVGVVIVVLAT